MKYNRGNGPRPVAYRVIGDDLAAATREGLAGLDGMAVVKQFVAAGVLARPRALEVKSPQARAEKADPARTA